MTKGTGPGAQGRSQSPPSRRQTPTPLLTLAHRTPLPVVPAGASRFWPSFLMVHSQNGLIAGALTLRSACDPVVSQRSHVVQHRIDPGIEKVHDLVGMKGAVAALLPLGSQYVHLD